jgi:hypothetical protein
MVEVVWTRYEVLKAYKIAIKNSLGQYKRIFQTQDTRQPFLYKYDLIIKRRVLLEWKKWTERHPWQNLVFTAGRGPLITTKAATEPEKFVILKLRSELMAAMKKDLGGK